MAAIEPLTPERARLALGQATLSDLTGVLAYTEGFGLAVAALGVAFDPLHLVRRMVDETIIGTRRWHTLEHSFPAHLRRNVRCDLTLRVWHQAEHRRPLPTTHADQVRLSVMQLGNVAGVLDAAHLMGEAMPALRERDESLLAPAVVLADLVRTRLERVIGPEPTLHDRRAALALFVADPESVPGTFQDEPTARLVAPPRPDGDDDRRDEN